MITSGQQWDFPNAWAPTTWVIIQGLRASGQHELAREIAEKWIRRNYDMYVNSGGRMFEKVCTLAATLLLIFCVCGAAVSLLLRSLPFQAGTKFRAFPAVDLS